MESNIRANGSLRTAKVLVSRYGPMGPSMRGIGKRIRLVVRANSLMPMETYMKANGKMIRQVASAFMSMQKLAQNTKDIGNMI